MNDVKSIYSYLLLFVVAGVMMSIGLAVSLDYALTPRTADEPYITAPVGEVDLSPRTAMTSDTVN